MRNASTSTTVFFHLVRDTVSDPVIPTLKHSKSVCLVCFVDTTPYLVDLPGNDPQKPPAAAFPEPRLNILGAL